MSGMTEAQRYADSWQELSMLERRVKAGMGSALAIMALTLVLTASGMDVGNYLMWPFFVAVAVAVTFNLQRGKVRCPRCDHFFLRATSDHARCAACGLERGKPPAATR